MNASMRGWGLLGVLGGGYLRLPNCACLKLWSSGASGLLSGQIRWGLVHWAVYAPVSSSDSKPLVGYFGHPTGRLLLAHVVAIIDEHRT